MPRRKAPEPVDPDQEAPAPPPLVPGVARALSPLVRRIVAPNPGMMTGPGHQHLPGRHRRDRGDRSRVPTGPTTSTPSRAAAAIASAGSSAPTPIPITRRARRASRRAPAPRSWPSTRATASRSTASSSGGAMIEATEFRLPAIHTPGHASNHLCFLLEEERMLFSGDHIMQGSTVVISPPDGNMAVYLESLATVRALRLRSIAPGHGHLIEDPRGAIDDYIEHRQAREQQILDLLDGLGHHQDRRPGRGHLRRRRPRAAPGGPPHRARPPAQAGQRRQGQGPLHRRQVDRRLGQATL